MQRYLAEKYMSGPKADAILSRDPTAKKKKRKQATSNNISNSGGNVAILDDDAGWGRPIKVDNDDEDDVKEAVVASDRTFKKRRRVGEDGGWISLPPEGQQEVEAEDEKPIVVNQDAQPQMTGGLMSHADLEARFATTQLANKNEEGPTEEQMETVYRDATGRKIDTKAARAEAARLKREKEEKEARRMEWGKGIVQRDEKAKARREMELERGQGFERYVAVLVLTMS
jgi:pre-mRNA-splicing factor CWC26